MKIAAAPPPLYPPLHAHFRSAEIVFVMRAFMPAGLVKPQHAPLALRDRIVLQEPPAAFNVMLASTAPSKAPRPAARAQTAPLVLKVP